MIYFPVFSGGLGLRLIGPVSKYRRFHSYVLCFSCNLRFLLFDSYDGFVVRCVNVRTRTGTSPSVVVHFRVFSIDMRHRLLEKQPRCSNC